MSLAAVIHISEFKENAFNAVSTVLGAKDRFQEVHIVYPGYVEGVQLYDGWDKHSQELDAAGILVHFVGELDAAQMKADYAVKIPPACFVKPGGIDLLQKDMRGSAPCETHFGLAAGVKLATASLWHGYLTVLAFIFFVWSRFERHKLCVETDVQARAVVRKGKHKYVATLPRWMQYVSKAQVRPRIVPQDVSLALVDTEGGFRFVWWTLRMNQFLSASWLWFIPLPRPWMATFGAYWLATFYSCVEVVKIVLFFAGVRPVTGYTAWSMTTVVMVSMWVINWMMALYASSRFYKFRWQFALSLAMPIYILTLPFALAYARLVDPKDGW